jgi:hypothetical protein
MDFRVLLMCRIGFVAFGANVGQDVRKDVLERLVRNSWDIGNRDGAGYVTWNPGQPAVLNKAVELKDLVMAPSVGAFALIHARTATAPKGIENTHPFEQDGAFLVHNGVVFADKAFEEKVKPLCKTTCDSEMILGAYLLGGRSLEAGMRKLTGHANVLLWDGQTKRLVIFPDGSSFMVYRQRGILLIVQEVRQAEGIIESGIGFPYEFAALQGGKIYELPLEEPTINWTTAYAKMCDSAVTAVKKTYVSETHPHYETRNGVRVYGDYGEYSAEYWNHRPYGETPKTDGPSKWEEARERKRKLKEEKRKERLQERLSELPFMPIEKQSVIIQGLSDSDRRILAELRRNRPKDWENFTGIA